MIHDLLEYLKSDETAEKLAMDNHKLKNGYYFVINNNEIEEIEIQKNNIVTTDIKIDEDWLKKVDYYSQIVSQNKALDSKRTFHNNSYLTLFFKLNKLKELSNNENDLLEAYDKYIDRANKKLFTKDFEYFRKKFNLEVINKTHMENSFQIIKNYLIDIKERVLSKEQKNDVYIKIFLFEAEDKYILEYKRYTYPLIFNTNDYNIEYENGILGIPDVNMSLNNKMPYLKHRSTPYVAPFLINIDNAIKEKQMLNFLDGQKGTREDKNKKEVEFNLTSGYIDLKEIELNNLKHEFEKANQEMHYLKFERGKTGVIITEYDFVPNYEDNFNFTYKNYFYYEPEKYSLTTEGTDCSTKQSVFQYINKSLYQSQLIQYLNTNASDISESKYLSSNLRKNIILNRDAYKNYFYKSDNRSLINVLDKSSLDAVLDLIYYRDDINFMKVKGALNTRFNLLNYFKIKGSYNMGSFLEDNYTRFKNILDEMDKAGKNDISILKDSKISSDEEFCYISGQYVRYILSKSEARGKLDNNNTYKKISYDMIQNFISKKNKPNKFQDEFSVLIEKYSHALESKRFKNTTSILLKYKYTNKKIDIDAFLVGFSSYCNPMFKNTESEDK